MTLGRSEDQSAGWVTYSSPSPNANLDRPRQANRNSKQE